jgi:Protein of unknown function (DUF3500)
MSRFEYKPFIDPSRVPRLSKAMCRMSLDDYPPPFEPLVGLWSRLIREPFRGLTSTGVSEPGLYSQSPTGAPVRRSALAALRWLEALAPEVRSRVSFPFDSSLWRHWHNTPLVLRDPQIDLEQLNDRQRELALELVKASLSERGFARTREVLENNQLLGELNDLSPIMNRWSFTLSVFGAPSREEPWGWQLFGHHLALNCVFFGERMILTPHFMGLEPDHDAEGGRRRLFEPHENTALKLMRSLSGAERSRAVLYESMSKADQPPGRFHPDDGRMVGGAFQDNRIVPSEGVPVGALSADSRLKVLELAELFIDNLPSGPAEARLSDIERELGRTYFAWIGPVDEVNPFYFRIHSPVALIEFDHHSGIFLANEEPARFHVHTVVRSPNGGDYGVDLLREHYARGGHRQEPGGLHSHDAGRTFHRHA